MRRPPNLICESLIVAETVDYLVSVGGRDSAVNQIEYVMNHPGPAPGLAVRLAQDIAERDPRLSVDGEHVELTERDHEAIDLAETGFVVFDLETTGAKAPPCRITEIGAYRVKHGFVTESFHTLVNPETPIPPFITMLTGISDDMVAGAPVFAEVVEPFLDFIDDSVLVAHNARFDMGFLNHEIGRVYEDYRLANPSLCTVQLSRRILPDIDNHKLKTVASHFSIDLVNHHRASDDAHATAHIFVNLLEDLRVAGVRDLGGVRSYVMKTRYARRSKITA
jgi:DNA polymerase III epsilon subunit family exonuclease